MHHTKKKKKTHTLLHMKKKMTIQTKTYAPVHEKKNTKRSWKKQKKVPTYEQKKRTCIQHITHSHTTTNTLITKNARAEKKKTCT